MRIGTILMGLGLVTTLAACQTFSRDMSVAEYCANTNNADTYVCKLSIDIDGQKTALADTDLKLSEAQAIAGSALSAANSAQSSADHAQNTANDALSRANSALLQEEDLECVTRDIRQSKIGTCGPGYTVMSCTQTHYTTRSGGPSILREINDQQCRFHDQVLEMAVRCCRASGSAITTN